MLMRVLILIMVLLLGGGIVYYLIQRPGGLSIPGLRKPSGITEISSKLPKDTGFLLILDLREGTDLKKELQNLRDKLKGNPKATEAFNQAEMELGVKLDDLCNWVQPSGFMGVLPASGKNHLWSTAAEGISQAGNQGQLTTCKSNLKNYATACEMYATDNSGRYPNQLGMLVEGNYFKTLPTCPTGGSGYDYEKAELPDNFTLTCKDKHGLANPPAYSGMQGLLAESQPDPTPETKAGEPEVIFGAPVKDEGLARTQLEKWLSQSNRKPVAETLNSSSFWRVGDAYTGVYKSYIVGASSREALERLLASFDGKSPNLTTNPLFTEMRKNLDDEQGLVGFLPLEGLAEALNALPAQSWDEKTRDNLRALRYLAGGASLENSNLKSSLVLGLVPGEKAEFAKSLLSPPEGPMVTADLFPADWNYYSAIDSRYLFHVLLEGARLVPEVRTQVDTGLTQLQAVSGVDIDKDLFGAFSGEVGWSGNYLQKLPELLNSNFSRARGQGQLTACKSNCKNIATACEMWSADNQGRYPEKLSQLTPLYLKTIPTCPSAGADTYSEAYTSAAQPDNFTFYCRGRHHGDENYPQYLAMQGLVEGNTSEPPPGPDPGMPTSVVAMAVKDAAKAESLLKRIDALVTFSAGEKVGETQILKAQGPQPIARALTKKPVPALLLAYGPEAEAMIKNCLEVSKPVSGCAEFQAIRQKPNEKRISQSFIDLKDILTGLTKLLDQAPDSEEKAWSKTLLAQVSSARGVGYTVVGTDHLRFVSEGNAAIATGGTAVVAAILVPNFIKARGQGQFTACKSNEKNLATALEMYSSDNAGRYPPDTSYLVQCNYLKTIPTCPAARKDTYSQTYRVQASPDLYTFWCEGENHRDAGAPSGYPQYDAEQGLRERP